MKRGLVTAFALSFCITVVAVFALTVSAQEAPRITKEELRGMLGNPDVIIIDVRLGEDLGQNDLRIKGAVREDPGIVNSWISKYPIDKTLVFYCA